MKKLVIYIKKRRANFIFFVSIIGIFTAVFALYNLHIEAVLYASAICIIPCIIWLCVDISKFYKEEEMKSQLDELTNETIRLQNIASAEKKELLDYYTLWTHQIKIPIAALKLLIQSKDYENSDLLLELFKIESYTELALTYLRAQSMSSDLLLKRYPLNEIVKSAIRKNSTLFIHKKIRLELSEFDTEVLTDKKWLGFVIEQILSNSLKYTPNEGKISIFTDVENNLIILDNGCGIAPDDLPRIFERGFTGQVGRTDSRATGLGLYLCKYVIDKLSHNIRIESEVGVGTTVRINLNSIKLTIE